MQVKGQNMAGIGIIANPHSKLNKRNPGRHRLLHDIAGGRGCFELTRNLKELDRVAREFRDRGVQVLAISGGDGTISRTISAFIRAYDGQLLPDIAVLRGGTMNMLAHNLGIRGTPEHNLFWLLQQHSADQRSERKTLRTLRINGGYGFLFANGSSARFLREFYRKKTGPVGSMALVAKIALSSFTGGGLFRKIVKNETMVMCLPDGRRLERGSLSVLCSTVERLPLGFRLFPGVGDQQEAFEVVSVTMDEKQLVRALAKDFFLFPDKASAGKFRLSTPSVAIENPGGGVYTLDGELYHSSEDLLTVSLGPGVRFLLPQAGASTGGLA